MYAGKIVETANVRELFDNPQHPYTIGLVNSVPRLDRKVERLASIEGQPPLLLNLPPGCRFAPRCYAVFDRCREEEPPHFAARRRPLRRVLESRVDERRRRCWKAQQPEEALPGDQGPGDAASRRLGARRGRRVVCYSRRARRSAWSASPVRARRRWPRWSCCSRSCRAAIAVRRQGRGKFGRAELKEYRSNVQAVFQDPWGSMDPRMRVQDHHCRADGRQHDAEQEGNPATGSSSCWRRSDCGRTRRSCIRTSSAAASVSALPWRARWRSIRGWWCWTNRCRRWTCPFARRS